VDDTIFFFINIRTSHLDADLNGSLSIIPSKTLEHCHNVLQRVNHHLSQFGVWNKLRVWLLVATVNVSLLQNTILHIYKEFSTTFITDNDTSTNYMTTCPAHYQTPIRLIIEMSTTGIAVCLGFQFGHFRTKTKSCMKHANLSVHLCKSTCIVQYFSK